MDSTVYNQKGESVGKVKLPESLFGVKWNADMVHQVVTSMLMSRRNNVAHAKTRGEVSGGGKKPWRQKGTGRARHGSIRSPIWVGGGTTHGPRNDKNYHRKVNKSEASKALASLLSRKLKDGEVLLIDSVTLAEKKTKQAALVLKSFATIKGFETLSKKKTNALYLAIPQNDEALKRSFRNIPSIEIAEVRNMNVVDVLSRKYVAFISPEESFKVLSARIGK
ncbi:MAG: 50S ribosomal protein L4 [Candidatus Taylorbacteria bacterium]|nr:50S ribosomal protein L4 [Candidatus Taylorbacteria bacterium]